MSQRAAACAREALDATSPADIVAWRRSCSGPGAGAWLLAPRSSADALADAAWRAAVLLRLGELRGIELYGKVLSDTVGGAVGRRHDQIRDLLAEWIKENTPRAVHTEQVLPEIQKPGTAERRMDVVTADHQGARLLVDVTVTHAVSANADRLARAAKQDGKAAQVEEGAKRDKYGGADGFTPFVFETGGRCGSSALALVRRLAPIEPRLRSECIGGLWQTLSVALQRHNATIVADAQAIWP